MIRVAIIGCGKIADQHATQVARYQGAELVGVCDSEELMARQLHDRYRAGAWFSGVEDLLTETRPDVVHITTPPQSHHDLGTMCLEAGSHVYIEKPFTVDAGEAERLIDLARDKKRKLTVGHNAQFTHAALRMRELIAQGALGGAPVHMESYYSTDLGDPGYARAFPRRRGALAASPARETSAQHHQPRRQ